MFLQNSFDAVVISWVLVINPTIRRRQGMAITGSAVFWAFALSQSGTNIDVKSDLVLLECELGGLLQLKHGEVFGLINSAVVSVRMPVGDLDPSIGMLLGQSREQFV